MKLAEALMERADLNVRIEQLRSRISNNMLVQEGEKSNENPEELLKELNSSVKRLEVLMAQINLTNCKTMVGDKSLTQIIAEKDAKSVLIRVYRDAAYEASQNSRRARGTEIKVLPTVSVVGLQNRVDSIAKEIRLLDNQLQMTNWQVDLIEE